MKIAVLSSHTPSLFWFRMDMMKEFLRRGNTVIAVGNESENEWSEKFSENGIRYIATGIQRNGTNPLKDIITYRSIKKILKAERPDKIFTYQAKTIIYGGMAAYKLKCFDTYPLIAGIGSIFLSDALKTKLIRAILVSEYRIGMKHAKKVFFQNPDDVEEFCKYKIVSPEKVVMLNGSGVNLEKYNPLPLPENPTFLCIGRLIRDKGIYEYLQAAKLVKERYSDARFMLVGPYDTNPSALKPEELQLYIDSGIIEYFGEQSDVRPYIAQCSVFVLPSYREGTPKTVLEAMACERAIITTNAPGCRETVTDGENGYLIPIKDVSALADRMIDLLHRPELVSQMASCSRRVVEEKFDVIKVNSKICDTMEI